MNPRLSLFCLTAHCVALLPGALAQTTVPHWSTYFGGNVREEAEVIRRGPGNLVTVVGHTKSSGLATAGALQTTIRGDADVFVARFDPSLPPAMQLRWCTYLGGSGLDLVFDAEVDPRTRETTLVGLSQSTDFPAPLNQPSPPLNGPSDGFVARIDAQGQSLLFSGFFGGSADDRINEVELVAGTGLMTIAGVTESTNLPATAGTVFPTYRGGGTDAFVGRVVPTQPPVVVWATHLGGSNTDGLVYSGWVNGGGWGMVWEGNLDRMALTLDGSGNPVLATASYTAAVPAVTTANACQPVNAGAADVYLAVVNPTGTALLYGTFHGGSLDERPKTIAASPEGGFVVGGATDSADLPVTPNCLQPAPRSSRDAFLVRIDPALGTAGRRYSTYLGGDAGEDNVLALAVETSGLVTLAGYTAGGNFPVTPRCLQPTAGAGQTFGVVARLQLAGQGASDLLYSTLVCPLGPSGTVLTGLALDEVGDAFVTGRSNATNYHLQNAFQATNAGGADAVITHLPLLPGGMPGTCVTRQLLALAMPACGMPRVPLYTGMAGTPLPGTTFGITATNAPPSSPGVLVLGAHLGSPFQVLNANLLVTPTVPIGTTADPLGFTRTNLTIPASLPVVPCWNLGAQWFFLTNATCPGTGLLGASERLSL
jgi:hypothetical protein